MATAFMPNRSEHSGWLTFAGLLAILVGLFNALDGIISLARRTFFVVGEEKIIFGFTAWGWILLILGIIQIVVGFAILNGQVWGRAAGVVLAILAAIGQLLFLPAYPIWSIIVIAMCVLLVYALTVPSRHAVG
ncbi:DUF7144 family membrane protein [Rhizohabitans arisaemae]|uniref:DUF7144 family membrane protein n=1 Tax=Rhizohabitans arisaemae TaxID=2720610 RepID=UPI0024B19DE9|nr:hypothetical protein [Rhizohabitans arisaemae]